MVVTANYVTMASLIPADETEEVQEMDPPADPADVQILVGGTFCRYTDDGGGVWLWRSPPWGYLNTRVQKWISPGVDVQGVCLYLSPREASFLFSPQSVPEWLPQKFSAFNASFEARKRSRQDVSVDDMIANFQPKRKV